MEKREILQQMYQVVKPYRTSLICAMICMSLVGVLSAGQAYMVKPSLDEIFFNKDRTMLTVIPIALVVLFLVKGVFYFGYTYLLNLVGQSVVRDLRNRIYQHLQTLPLSFFHRTPTGELISRLISDVTLIQAAVSNALVGLLKDSCQVICLLGVIFFMNWKLALMSVVFLPLAIFPIVNFGRKHRKYSTQNQQTTAHISNIIHEAITGNRIVKTFCMENYEIRRFNAMVEKLFQVIMQDARVRCLAHPVMELLGGVGIAMIMWYGGRQVLNGESTPGTFFSFLTSLIMIYDPIKGVSNINSMVQQGLAAATRIFDLLEIKADIVDQPTAQALPLIRHSIEFKNVTFAYKHGLPVLDRINLQVNVGETVALVGVSGSGKTTLVDLLPRFYDVNEGSICIDGKDIREVTVESLRGQIGMVTQQTILFNDTIRNNIAYGSQERPEEELMEAARAAHALDFISRQSEGFDTIIGESGMKLSGGERQRLSIARAMLKNAPILILDEATSALDNESEREVQTALENLMRNRTTLVIAHRLSTIRNADRIIVMQRGRIVEQGSHEHLLALNGVYKMLHEMQS